MFKPLIISYFYINTFNELFIIKKMHNCGCGKTKPKPKIKPKPIQKPKRL